MLISLRRLPKDIHWKRPLNTPNRKKPTMTAPPNLESLLSFTSAFGETSCEVFFLEAHFHSIHANRMLPANAEQEISRASSPKVGRDCTICLFCPTSTPSKHRSDHISRVIIC